MAAEAPIAIVTVAELPASAAPKRRDAAALRVMNKSSVPVEFVVLENA